MRKSEREREIMIDGKEKTIGVILNEVYFRV